jgi:hypothetical protein
MRHEGTPFLRVVFVSQQIYSGPIITVSPCKKSASHMALHLNSTLCIV